MTDTNELDVPFTTFEFLALACSRFADANAAFWRVSNALGIEPTAAQVEHLDHLRDIRKEAFSDLMAWAMQAEAERLGARPPLATPPTRERRRT